MNTKIIKTKEILKDQSVIYLMSGNEIDSSIAVSKLEREYVNERIASEETIIELNHYNKHSFFVIVSDKKDINQISEKLRREAVKVASLIQKFKIENIVVVNKTNKETISYSFVEGLLLANYQFLKYFSDKSKKENLLKQVYIHCKYTAETKIQQLETVLASVYIARDLVNEPLISLNAEKFAKKATQLGERYGFSVEVFNKKKIESLKMGGLLAVNMGSIDPPTFSVLEWKPQNAKNTQPVVLVGKGVMYDTGGLSLKPTANSMDIMKSDMAGAAAVLGAFCAVAANKLPVHIIGLIPATDNRPDGNAYTPGDVITMFNNKTVEVLNTDAEGRMILADALSYADRYNPMLVIDLATLTGAAHAAIGHYGIVAMGNAEEALFNQLINAGENTNERIVTFPFWDEYKELIKSDIADLKNIGGKVGGAITAGKFLEHFTDSPYIHLDIAGPAFMTSNDGYLLKGGTGVGVRLLYEFILNLQPN